MSATADLKWVSCRRSDSPTTASYRHLIRPGRDTTLCGTTGLGGVWRGNSTKPFCPRCQERYEVLDSASSGPLGDKP